jgi:superfamily I DNA and/or RNA helicase
MFWFFFSFDSLIPLHLLCPRRGRVVLVGDPKQLPSTVLSHRLAATHYGRSLFERLETLRPAAASRLAVQYRMHPAIMAFPSEHYYGGRLRCGDGCDESSRAAPYHALAPPLCFFDLPSSESKTGLSHVNREEARFIVETLLRPLLATYDAVRLEFFFLFFRREHLLYQYESFCNRPLFSSYLLNTKNRSQS